MQPSYKIDIDKKHILFHFEIIIILFLLSYRFNDKYIYFKHTCYEIGQKLLYYTIQTEAIIIVCSSCYIFFLQQIF